MTKQDKMLEKVRALIAKANSTNFEEEANTFRAKADELMAAHAIAAWQLEAEEEGREPVSKDIDTRWYWEYKNAGARSAMWQLFHHVARHCRCKLIWWEGTYTTPVIGLPADLEYLDLLFTSLLLQASKAMNPKADGRRSMGENIRVMKEAGLNWDSIASELVRVGQLEEPDFTHLEDSIVGSRKELRKRWVHGLGLSNVYTRYCEEQGIERVYANPTTYQRSFAEGFEASVSRRLHRQARQHEENSEGNSMALVVRDIREALNDKAEELYGKAPKGRSVSRDYSTDYVGYGRGSEAGKKADISGNPSRSVKGGGRQQLRK